MIARVANIARRQRHVRQSSGFTIVETMIVLAVTGVLFVSVMAVMSGKQSKTQFNQAMNSLKTQVEQVIGEVQSGYFPDTGGFSCIGGNLTGGSSAQGTNVDCVFLGKVIQFNKDDDFNYVVYPVSGLKDATSITDSNPRVVGALKETKRLQHGLKPANNYAIAVLTKLDSGGSSGLTTDIYPLAGSMIAPNSTLNLGGVSAGTAQLCFASGTTQQGARLTVEGNSVTIEVKNKQDCTG